MQSRKFVVGAIASLVIGAAGGVLLSSWISVNANAQTVAPQVSTSSEVRQASSENFHVAGSDSSFWIFDVANHTVTSCYSQGSSGYETINCKKQKLP